MIEEKEYTEMNESLLLNKQEYFEKLSDLKNVDNSAITFDYKFHTLDNLTLRDMIKDFLFFICQDIYETPDLSNKIFHVLAHSAYSVDQLIRLFRETNYRHYATLLDTKLLVHPETARQALIKQIDKKLRIEYFYQLASCVFKQSICIVVPSSLEKPIFYFDNYNFLLNKIDVSSLQRINDKDVTKLDYTVVQTENQVNVCLKTTAPHPPSPSPANNTIAELSIEHSQQLNWYIVKAMFDQMYVFKRNGYENLLKRSNNLFHDLKITHFNTAAATTTATADSSPKFKTDEDTKKYKDLMIKLDADKDKWNENLTELLKFMKEKNVQTPNVCWTDLESFEKKWITYLYYIFDKLYPSPAYTEDDSNDSDDSVHQLDEQIVDRCRQFIK